MQLIFGARIKTAPYSECALNALLLMSHLRKGCFVVIGGDIWYTLNIILGNKSEFMYATFYGGEMLKKHIIIAGVPRSGKSTISQKIANDFGYQHISMDSIIAGIESVFPETNIDSDADTDPYENTLYISSKMAPFLRAMMDSGEYDECDYGMVIDIYQLLP